MQHFKEALIVGAFTFLFSSALGGITKYNRKSSPKIHGGIIGGISALLAVATVKLFLLNGVALR